MVSHRFSLYQLGQVKHKLALGLGASLLALMMGAPLQASAAEKTDWNEEVLYFVIPDRYADARENTFEWHPTEPGYFHGGDWAGLTGQLDQLQELGITALWITPIVKQIPGYVDGAGFKDFGYHGYWADDFNALDERMGTEAELKELINEAHKRGIKVLVDVVLNHPGYGARYTTTNPEWVRQGNECGDDDLTACLFGLPDFKTELEEVRNYVISAHINWAKRLGFDGYRIDTIKHVEKATQRANREQTRAQLGDDFFLLGEHWDGNVQGLTDIYFEPDLLDSGLDFSFRSAAKIWITGRTSTANYSGRFLSRRHRDTKGGVLAHFLSSHDQPGLLTELEGDTAKFRLAAGLQMTSLGLPVIYYGEEVARDIGEWPDNRSNMPWGAAQVGPGDGDPRDEEMRAYYKRLLAVRKAHPALASGSYEELSAQGDVLSFARRKGENGVIVAANRAAQAETVVLNLPEDLAATTTWHHQLSEGQATVREGKLSVTVPPLSVVVLAP